MVVDFSYCNRRNILRLLRCIDVGVTNGYFRQGGAACGEFSHNGSVPIEGHETRVMRLLPLSGPALHVQCYYQLAKQLLAKEEARSCQKLRTFRNWMRENLMGL